MIRVIEITKKFNIAKPNELSALKKVNCTIEPGKVTVFKGPSGSGKTTLLCIIGCMIRPTSGRVLVFDREVTSLPERFLTAIRQTTFGFVFQKFNLISGMTALQNVLLPAYPLGKPYHEIKKHAMQLLSDFALSSKADIPVQWLSGGEAQRVAIVRALINDPAVVIADEPTAHLDSMLSNDFMFLINHLKDTGKTVIISSHDPIVYKSPIVDNVINMRDGQIVDGF